jgi:hypothetical protein
LRGRLTLFALAGALTLLCGCNTVGIGTRVTDLGDGRYRIVTSQADDVATANAAAARDRCPGGFAVLQKGSRAESLYGSVIRGSDLATFWIIRCTSTK